MKQETIDFGDLLHGVDVLEEYASVGNVEQVNHVLGMIGDDIEGVTGSAAEHIHTLLFSFAFGTPVDISELRAAINALAVDYATAADAIVKQKSRKKGTASNKDNAAEKHKALRAAAKKRWKEKPRYSVKAIADYLIENKIATLKERRVRDIIKDLKPPK